MRLSLGFILALSLAGLQFVAILTVVLTSYVTSERALLEQARDLLEETGGNVSDRSQRFLKPARDAVELSSNLIESDIIAPDRSTVIERFLFQNLRTEPQISGLFYGDEQGNFIYVMRSDGAGPFRSKLVLYEGDERTTELIWREADFSEVTRRFDPEDKYDPRARPWYRSAKGQGKSIWSAPYIFFSSQQPGITVASPVFDADGAVSGVVGGDIELSAISHFLSGLEIGERGVALVLNDNGDVIAHPDTDLIKVKGEDGSVSFANITEMNDMVARAAFGDLARGGSVSIQREMQADFQFAQERYVSLVRPFPDVELPWTIAIYAPENDFTQGIKDNRRRNIWIAVIISLATAAAGIVLAELILRPVRAFAVRTALVSQGEVADSDALPRTYKELSRANETLIDEIAQRREADAKILDLNRDLSHFARVNLMGQMATGLAHELAQPLTAITQNVDAAITTAKEGQGDNSELLEILEELDEQAHRGGDIVRALRGFVRKDEQEAEEFSFSELLEQTRSLLHNEAKTHDVQIRFEAGKLPPAYANRVQIAQVLTNLLRNAMEAIAQGQSAQRIVEVTAQVVEDRMEVCVEDTGPGVAEGVTLFKQFETSKAEGMGLGLSICRRIVETNGGRLWHDASALETTRFCFTIPIEG